MGSLTIRANVQRLLLLLFLGGLTGYNRRGRGKGEGGGRRGKSWGLLELEGGGGWGWAD